MPLEGGTDVVDAVHGTREDTRHVVIVLPIVAHVILKQNHIINGVVLNACFRCSEPDDPVVAKLINSFCKRERERYLEAIVTLLWY